MIVSFKLKNYRSFYDEKVLDFRLYEDESVLKENPFAFKINNEYISKLCMIYGHNGSGKSNILNALQYVLWRRINRLFDPNMIKGAKEDSIFELEFYSDKNEDKVYKLYNYKLVLDNKNELIKNETFSCGDKNIFVRDKNSVKIQGENLNAIPDKISTFDHLDSIKEYKSIIKDYFQIIRTIVPSDDFSLKATGNSDIASRIIKDYHKDFKRKYEIWNFYNEMIKLSDTGIDEIVIETSKKINRKQAIEIYEEIKRKKEKSSEDKEFLSFLKDQINNNFEKMVSETLFSTRLSPSGKGGKWKARFSEVESEGTKMYSMHMLNIVLSLYEGCLSIHDEIRGVQTDLVKLCIFLFEKDLFKEVKSDAQILLTTHDPLLMKTKNILTSNIWFVDKKDNISDLYNASAFEDITIDNLFDAYIDNQLGGRYKTQSYAVPLTFSSKGKDKDDKKE